MRGMNIIMGADAKKAEADRKAKEEREAKARADDLAKKQAEADRQKAEAVKQAEMDRLRRQEEAKAEQLQEQRRQEAARKAAPPREAERPATKAPEVGAPTSPLDPPGFAIGHRWLRTDGEYTLTVIDKSLYVFVAPGEREIRLTKNLGLASVKSGGYRTAFDPPIEVRKWPLREESWGEISTTWQVPLDARDLPVSCVWSIGKSEDVTLPGGTVQAIRMVYEWQPARPDSITSSSFPKKRLILWYAPHLQQLVKGEYSDKGPLNFQGAMSGPREAPAPHHVPSTGPR